MLKRTLEIGFFYYAEKRYTDFLYNCYLSDQATNTYTPISRWVKCYKLEMNGGTENGLAFYEHDATANTFTDNDWIEVFRVSETTFTYKGNNVSIIKRKSGAFVADELDLNNIGIDETNSRLYVKMSDGTVKYATLN